MTFEVLVAAATFAFVTSVTPGPNNTFLLTSGVNFGVRRSLNYVNGIIAGLALLQMSIGFGLGLVFATFPVVYQVLKYVGFGYMLYLAYGIVRHANAGDSGTAKYSGFGKALAFQFLNPKAWIVSISFMATYVPVDKGGIPAILTCATFLVFTYPGAVIWAGFGSILKNWLSDPRTLRVFNVTAAALLVLTMLPVLFLH